jgi:phosphate starvation-inducible protein PhoH and related proteins
MAAKAISDGSIDKIIVTRPVVEAGESLGFLPGELDEKYEPYLQPLRQVFNERLGKSQTEMFLKNGKIEPVPLAYMRGMTFKDCFVILDEAQNVTPQQMKMFLTRIGDNCTVIVNGDPDQKDIPGPSGLDDAIKRVGFIPVVKVVRFDVRDVVRSDLVGEILEAYRNK